MNIHKESFVNYGKLPDIGKNLVQDYAKGKFMEDPSKFMGDTTISTSNIVGQKWDTWKDQGLVSESGTVGLGDLLVSSSKDNSTNRYMPKPKDPIKALEQSAPEVWGNIKDIYQERFPTEKWYYGQIMPDNDQVREDILTNPEVYREALNKTRVDQGNIANFVTESVKGKEYYQDGKINVEKWYESISSDLSDVQKEKLNTQLWQKYGEKAVPQEFNKKMEGIKTKTMDFLKNNWGWIAGGVGAILAMWLLSSNNNQPQTQVQQQPQQRQPSPWSHY